MLAALEGIKSPGKRKGKEEKERQQLTNVCAFGVSAYLGHRHLLRDMAKALVEMAGYELGVLREGERCHCVTA